MRTVTTVSRYEAVRNQIKTGDCIAFADDTLLSRIIRWFTRANYSHIGMVVRMETDNGFGDSVMLIESTTTVHEVDEEFGYVVKGVQLHWLSRRLASYNGRAWLVPLSQPIPETDRLRMESWLRNQHAEKISYDYLQVIGLGIRELTGLGFMNHEDLSKLFCSELTTRALQVAGIVAKDINASSKTPVDVVSMSCFDAPQVLLD